MSHHSETDLVLILIENFSGDNTIVFSERQWRDNGGWTRRMIAHSEIQQ